MKIQVQGSASEAAIQKATAMLNQLGIQPNPKPVSIGRETIKIDPNNGNPYAVIQSHGMDTPSGALVWKAKERKERNRRKQKEARDGSKYK